MLKYLAVYHEEDYDFDGFLRIYGLFNTIKGAKDECDKHCSNLESGWEYNKPHHLSGFSFREVCSRTLGICQHMMVLEMEVKDA